LTANRETFVTKPAVLIQDRNTDLYCVGSR